MKSNPKHMVPPVSRDRIISQFPKVRVPYHFAQRMYHLPCLSLVLIVFWFDVYLMSSVKTANCLSIYFRDECDLVFPFGAGALNNKPGFFL